MIPAISLRQMQYFVAVFEEGSFSRAANRENCTQPALSSQIRNLEEIVDNHLFERSVTGVTPTAAGKRFYRHAVAILRSLHVAEQEMAEVSGHIAGTVRIGLIPSVVRGLIPSFLPTFVETHPDIDLHIIESFSGTLIEWVLTQELDLAMVVEPPSHNGLDMIEIAKGPAVLITGQAAGFTSGALSLKDLPPLKMVLPAPRHSMRAIIERSIWARTLHVTRVLEMDSVCGMIEFVRNSDWATILPLTAVVRDFSAPDLVLNTITDPQFDANLYLIHLQRLPPNSAAREFINALRAEALRAPEALDISRPGGAPHPAVPAPPRMAIKPARLMPTPAADCVVVT